MNTSGINRSMSVPANPLAVAALRTLLYYDIFDYPLTECQLYFFLHGESSSRKELLAACHDPAFTHHVDTRDGYYFLKGKGHLVQKRRNEQVRAGELWRMAVAAASRMRHLPFVRGICISGDLSKEVAGEDSDIDFFIITAAHRVWICKLGLTLFRHIPWFNPHRLLCFNYLVSEEHLQLGSCNIFTAAEIAGLAPLYHLTNFNRFIHTNNWAGDFVPRYHLAPNPDHCLFHGRSNWQRASELLLRNPLATLLDRVLQEMWRTAWRWKYRHDPGTRQRLISGIQRHLSKSHGYPNDTQILEEFHRRLRDRGLM
jgi:hypothetical protein